MPASDDHAAGDSEWSPQQKRKRRHGPIRADAKACRRDADERGGEWTAKARREADADRADVHALPSPEVRRQQEGSQRSNSGGWQTRRDPAPTPGPAIGERTPKKNAAARRRQHEPSRAKSASTRRAPGRRARAPHTRRAAGAATVAATVTAPATTRATATSSKRRGQISGKSGPGRVRTPSPGAWSRRERRGRVGPAPRRRRSRHA